MGGRYTSSYKLRPSKKEYVRRLYKPWSQYLPAYFQGLEKQTQRHTRFLKYDIRNKRAPVYAGEWVVPLPLYIDPTAKPSKNPKAAAQSEILALENGQFFVLSRDSSAGNGQEVTQSVYRQIDVVDLSGATNIKAAGSYDCVDSTCTIADVDTGSLKSGVTAAKYCSFLDFNVNAQLNRFNVHNGGKSDAGLLVSNFIRFIVPIYIVALLRHD